MTEGKGEGVDYSDRQDDVAGSVFGEKSSVKVG